jgi:DNA polymerase III subunit delta
MAAKGLHAIDYLAQADKYPPRPVCVIFGDETFLKRQVLLKLREQVLAGEEADFSLTTFEGRGAVLRDVLEELATLAMFGSRRLVIVEEADDFVTRYRAELEDYVAKPRPNAVLVLELKTFASNTRLYKAVDASGLLVACEAPAATRLPRWLGDWANRMHHVQLPAAAAEMLVDMMGPELGLIDQEIARLALLAEKQTISPTLVQQQVSSWRAKTTWEMLDAALDGQVVVAMRELDRLLASGEVPLGLLAQISSSLRRLAAATRLMLQTEAAGRRTTLGTALQQAGVRSFVVQKAERQLRRLGRARGSQIYDWLLEADLDLKGDSPMPPRLILERLIVRLAASQEAMSGPAR